MTFVVGSLHFGELTLDPGNLLAWAAAALLAGWLAGKLVRGRGFGCLGDILLGVVGAIVGLFVISLLPLHISGTLGFLGTLVVAFLGALALALVARILGGGNRRRVVVIRRPPTPGSGA
ncbi:MAG TPA: GlsB/YeaQ/YmgE family stress response membrane protein [Ktedonobacterales bacterium]|nr:GlsB/YeaQ/YmgE family stress response membrane protein [Ktedonobacterales bacterium]